MKSKRMLLFALFSCVFALYGCVSSVSKHVAVQSMAVNIDKFTLQDESYRSKVSASQKQYAQRKTMLAVIEGKYQNTLSFRHLNGELKAKRSMEKMAATYANMIKDNRKKQAAKKAAEAKKREEEARTFTGKLTTYGVDCYGCTNINGRGGTAIGVGLDIAMGVQQPDGNFLPGIQYGQYYIVAADPNVPMCSILKISNHGLEGNGIHADKPFYAIVLDRGGAIYGGHIDLYVGSEKTNAMTRVAYEQPSIQIIRMGGQQGRTCAL